MDKDVKFSISKTFTVRSISFLLFLSVIATCLGFGVAYNEHRNLAQLQDKYDEAMVKIEKCEESVSALSQQIAAMNTVVTEGYTEYSEYNEEEYSYYEGGTTEYSVGTEDKTESTTAATSAVSSGKYYVTKSGSKYHIGTCSFLSKSKIPITSEQIKAKGYTPCSRCIK